jgi:hypothetical protein
MLCSCMHTYCQPSRKDRRPMCRNLRRHGSSPGPLHPWRAAAGRDSKFRSLYHQPDTALMVRARLSRHLCVVVVNFRIWDQWHISALRLRCSEDNPARTGLLPVNQREHPRSWRYRPAHWQKDAVRIKTIRQTVFIIHKSLRNRRA